MRLISPKSTELSRRKLLTGAAALAAYAEGFSPGNLEAQSPCGTFYPTPPPQAAAAGTNQLVFADDFTVNTFATSQNQASGANWS